MTETVRGTWLTRLAWLSEPIRNRSSVAIAVVISSVACGCTSAANVNLAAANRHDGSSSTTAMTVMKAEAISSALDVTQATLMASAGGALGGIGGTGRAGVPGALDAPGATNEMLRDASVNDHSERATVLSAASLGTLVASRIGSSVGPVARRRYVVAAMGDSLTDPRAHGGKYLDVLRARCPKSRFDSFGMAGQMVSNMRARFAYEVLGDGRPQSWPWPGYTHVIVLGGVNDIGSDKQAHRPAERIEEDLAAMYAMAHERGLGVIAMTLSPWSSFKAYYTPSRGEKTHAVNTWIRNQVEAHTVDHVIDAHALLSCGDPDELCATYENRWVRDGLHFNVEAHQKLGEALYESAFSDCE